MSRRAHNKRIAIETMNMFERGAVYTALDDDDADGREVEVDVSELLVAALTATTTYTPTETQTLALARERARRSEATCFEATLETTLSACRRAAAGADAPTRVGALNFASAKHPGGGFLKGASAQEESLARASALYPCIRESRMYAANTAAPNWGLYNHYIVVSADVPVVRADDYDGRWLAQPYTVTFVSAPAVNARVARANGVPVGEIARVTRERADRVLAAALAADVDVFVLGSWGCGVFGGDVHAIAAVFVELLTSKYANAFTRVVFATLDESHRQAFAQALRRRPRADRGDAPPRRR